MNHTAPHPFVMEGSSYRRAGLVMAGATLLGLLAVAMHPVVSNAHTPQDMMSQIAAFAMHDAVVHGSLMVLLTVITCGFVKFADLLGAQHDAVRFGKAAYVSGYALTMLAMLVDGFIVPAFGTRLAGAEPADLQAAFVVLQAIGILIQVLTKAGVVAMSVAFIAWSRTLSAHTEQAWQRMVAWAGFAIGLGSIAVMLFGGIRLGPHSLVAVFGTHAIWNWCVAAILLQVKPHAQLA